MSAYQAAQLRNLNDKQLLMNQSASGIGDIQGDDTINNGFRIIDSSNNIVRSFLPGNNIQARVVDNKQIVVDAMLKLTTRSKILNIQTTDKTTMIDTTLLENLLESYIANINDITKGSKYIMVQKKDSSIIFDASNLSSALESMKLNINKIIPIVGARISFDKLNILSQWGQISLDCKSIQKQAVGTYTIAFSKELPHNNYGVLVSLQSSDAGFILYNNTTTKGITITTYNARGKLSSLDGDMTIEIKC